MVSTITRGALDKLTGWIIPPAPDSQFWHQPVSSQMPSIIRIYGQIVFLTTKYMSHLMHSLLLLCLSYSFCATNFPMERA